MPTVYSKDLIMHETKTVSEPLHVGGSGGLPQERKTTRRAPPPTSVRRPCPSIICRSARETSAGRTDGRGRADGRHVLQGRREVCLRSRGGDVKMYIQCAVNRRLSGQNILRPCAVLHPMFPIVQPRLQKALAVESIRAMCGTCLESRLCIAVNGS